MAQAPPPSRINLFLEEQPWRAGLILGVALGAMVAALSTLEGGASPFVAGLLALLSGGAVMAGVALLGLQAAELAERAGPGRGAGRLLGVHPWRTAGLIGVLAAVVRAGAGVAGGAGWGEATQDGALFFITWFLVLGALGRFGVRQPKDSGGGSRR